MTTIRPFLTSCDPFFATVAAAIMWSAIGCNLSISRRNMANVET